MTVFLVIALRNVRIVTNEPLQRMKVNGNKRMKEVAIKRRKW